MPPLKALAFVALLPGSATAGAQTSAPFPLEKELAAADTEAKLAILSNLSKSDLPAGFWVAERGFWDTSPKVRDAAILTWLKLADTLPREIRHGYDRGPLPGLESFRRLGVKALPALKLGLEERLCAAHRGRRPRDRDDRP